MQTNPFSPACVSAHSCCWRNNSVSGVLFVAQLWLAAIAMAKTSLGKARKWRTNWDEEAKNCASHLEEDENVLGHGVA